MKHFYKMDGVMYVVAGVAMMVIFVGLPATRFTLAFAAWGTFDSCDEALILGNEGDKADQARERESSVTISGPVLNLVGAITAAAYIFFLCIACYPCVARLNFQRDSKAQFELEQNRAGSPQEAGAVEQPEMPP